MTLKDVIVQYVLPGTHTVSDGWAAYAQIGDLNHGICTHDVIVHQEHFLDPNDDAIYTQNVENLWCASNINSVDSLAHLRHYSHHTMNLCGMDGIRIVWRFLTSL